MRKTYGYYRERGICVDCHKRNAVAGRVRCEECLAAQKSAQTKYRSLIYAQGGDALEEYRRMKRFSTKKWRTNKEVVA